MAPAMVPATELLALHCVEGRPGLPRVGGLRRPVRGHLNGLQMQVASTLHEPRSCWARSMRKGGALQIARVEKGPPHHGGPLDGLHGHAEGQGGAMVGLADARTTCSRFAETHSLAGRAGQLLQLPRARGGVWLL